MVGGGLGMRSLTKPLGKWHEGLGTTVRHKLGRVEQNWAGEGASKTLDSKKHVLPILCFSSSNKVSDDI